MKKLLLFVALLAVTVFSGGLAATTSNAKDVHKERGIMKFNQPVSVLGVVLKGEYLFVHDNDANARGETCTFIYKGTVESLENLVAFFHCTPAIRAKAKSFVVRTRQTDGITELQEIQFAGSTEAHIALGHQPHH
jgi:hypothetical protein